MQRSKKAGDARLSEKYTVGIGGHVRQEDLVETSIQEWGWREFHEEIEYQGKLHIKTLGMINDDSNDVGRVHLGFVFLAYGNTDQISIKSELQSGHLVSLEEAYQKGDQLESWTKIIIQTLLQQK
jgi:predicted NUDIX family phosphoesterase